jgi:hypothetical protein
VFQRSWGANAAICWLFLVARDCDFDKLSAAEEGAEALPGNYDDPQQPRSALMLAKV